MNRIKILTVLVAGALSYTGCTKQSQNDLLTSSTVANSVINTTDSAYSSVISYQFTSMPTSSGSIFQWTSGYFNIAGLAFDVTHENGEMLTQKKYGTAINKNVMLYQDAALGLVKVPGGLCDHASFTVSLASSSGHYALYLSGTSASYPPGLSRIVYTPTELIVDVPVDINTIWLSNVMVNPGNYTASITLNLAQAMTGITPVMMNSATVTDGKIIISSTYNTTLYNIILANLASNITNVQFSAANQFSAQTNQQITANSNFRP